MNRPQFTKHHNAAYARSARGWTTVRLDDLDLDGMDRFYLAQHLRQAARAITEGITPDGLLTHALHDLADAAAGRLAAVELIGIDRRGCERFCRALRAALGRGRERDGAEHAWHYRGLERLLAAAETYTHDPHGRTHTTEG